MSKIICKVCGSAYSYCPGCVKDMDKPRWMVSFDRHECKEVFDALVKNSSGQLSDADALNLVERSGVKIVGKSVVKHVNKLKSARTNGSFNSSVLDVTSVQVEPKQEEVKSAAEEKKEEKPLFKKNEEGEEKKSEEVKVEKGLGSLFGNNQNFTSNSRNKEKVKQDAGSIASAIDQLNEKQGF